jgi:cell division protein FtsW
MISKVNSNDRNRVGRRVPPPVRNVPVNSGGRIVYGAPDYPLLVIAMVLTCIGVLMVFSASGMFSITQHRSGFYFLWKELIWVVISVVMMFVTAFFDYRYFRKIGWFVLGGAVFLLMIVLIPHVGIKVNGARRWLGFGGFTLHVGEVAKLSVIVFFAVMLDKAGESIKQPVTVARLLGVLGVVALLILKEPDFGMTAVTLLICMAMMYIAGAKKRHLGAIAVFGVMAAVMLVLHEPYRMRRMMGFMNLSKTAANEGYQTMQSLIGFGSGGFFGKGLGESTQKLMYLPEQHTDFIFAIVGEELGILGLLLVVVLFVYLTYRGLHIAQKCEDPLAVYLVFGVIFMISTQAFVNMGVALGMLPVTGLTLPFISFGGSSLMCTYMGIGILLNISMNSMAMTKRRGYEEHSIGGWGHRGTSVPGDRPRPVHTKA